MNFLRTAPILAISLAAALAPAQSTGIDLLRTFRKYQADRIQTEESKNPPNYENASTDIRNKATELLKGADTASATGDNAAAFAALHLAAGQPDVAKTLALKGIQTAQTASAKNNSAITLADVGASTDDFAVIYQALTTFQVQDRTSGLQFAIMASQYASFAAESCGVAKAIAELDRAAAGLKPADYTSAQDQAIFRRLSDNLLLARVETYRNAGDRANAIKAADTAFRTVDDLQKPRVAAIKKQLEMPGQPAPALTVDRGYGAFQSLAALKGKVVIVDFIAHWCGPCIESFPEYRKLLADKRADGLEVVGVTMYYGYYNDEKGLAPDVEYARMAKFIKDNGVEWPVVFGPPENFTNYGVSGIPHATVIDRKGVVHSIEVGYSPEQFAKFRKDIEALLAEK